MTHTGGVEMQASKKQENYRCTYIANVFPGQVLYGNVYVNNKLLLKSGDVLTVSMIEKIKFYNIQFVTVEDRNRTKSSASVMPVATSSEEKRLIDSIKSEFYTVLSSLSVETRYGRFLNNKEDILYVRNLFISYMRNPYINKFLMGLKTRDEYSYKHSVDVFLLSTLFAKHVGIRYIEDIALGFLLHDLGKLNAPPEILLKKSTLTTAENLQMQRHVFDGAAMLDKLGLSHVAYLAKYHHERVDGSGYPEGLTANKMPTELQILQIIDVFSAITLQRVYNDEVAAAEGIRELFKDKHLFNVELIKDFADCIGIYPVGAIVVLSEGSLAEVVKVNPNFPLLPEMKLLKTNQLFSIPQDFSVKVSNIIDVYINDALL